MNAAAEGWQLKSPQERISAGRNMTQSDFALRYVQVRPTKPEPRLTLREWEALGDAGRRALKPYLEGWERDIVDRWSLSEERALQPLPTRRAAHSAPVPAQGPGEWTSEEFKNLVALGIVIPPAGLLVGFFGLFRGGKIEQAAKLLVISAVAPFAWMFLWGLVRGLLGH